MRIDGLVCDLDGVLYRGDVPIPGAIEKLRELSEAGLRLVFCTNNSNPTVDAYVSKLGRLGLDVARDQLVSSAVVAAEVLAGSAGSTAIVIGGDGIREALATAGLREAESDAREADLVLVGFDPTFTYAEMKRAAFAVRDGAALVATNEDASFPAPDGLWPGAGAILASIERATGARARVLGKPNDPMMDVVARRLKGCRAVAIVGDRPDTDLAGGVARGWKTILVLSGVTEERDVPKVTPRPDLVLGSLAELEAELPQ